MRYTVDIPDELSDTIENLLQVTLVQAIQSDRAVLATRLKAEQAAARSGHVPAELQQPRERPVAPSVLRSTLLLHLLTLGLSSATAATVLEYAKGSGRRLGRPRLRTLSDMRAAARAAAATPSPAKPARIKVKCSPTKRM